MKISVLLENTAISPDVQCEHGLSLHIETEGRTILFDTGASDLFCANAVRMGIHLAAVDLVVLSHGHCDHSGGLAAFLACNDLAPVYVSRHAFGDYCVKKENGETHFIGVDPALVGSGRMRYVDDRLDLDENTLLFSGVGGDYPRPSGNSRLLMGIDGHHLPDDFRHEQNLILTTRGGKRILFAGCAHSGMVNILDHSRRLCGAYPDLVVGGLHLIDRGTSSEDFAELDALAQQLLQSGAMFYTCHCTGLSAYERLRQTMGDRITYFAAGAELTVE